MGRRINLRAEGMSLRGAEGELLEGWGVRREVGGGGGGAGGGAGSGSGDRR
jgi:hypothetical protein